MKRASIQIFLAYDYYCLFNKFPLQNFHCIQQNCVKTKLKSPNLYNETLNLFRDVVLKLSNGVKASLVAVYGHVKVTIGRL